MTADNQTINTPAPAPASAPVQGAPVFTNTGTRDGYGTIGAALAFAARICENLPSQEEVYEMSKLYACALFADADSANTVAGVIIELLRVDEQVHGEVARGMLLALPNRFALLARQIIKEYCTETDIRCDLVDDLLVIV